MSLGIAVYVAIRVSTENALQSFISSSALLGGKRTIHISGVAGKVPESVIPQLRAFSQVRAVAPLSTRYVQASDGINDLGTVLVIGSDLLQTRELGYWQESTAKKREYKQTELLRGPPHALVSPTIGADRESLYLIVDARPVAIAVAGSLPEEGLARAFGGKVVVLDISQYQEVFSEFQVVDGLDILLQPNEDSAAFLTTLQTQLPEGLVASEENSQAKQAETMTEAFRLNLTFLAGISLFVALLLIYNTFSYAVLKRRHEFGTLLSLGATRRVIVSALGFESVLSGALAAVLGLGFGYFLSYRSLAMVGMTFSNLYTPVAVSTPQLTARVIAEAMCIGPLVALLGSILPTLELYRIPPRESFGYLTYEERFSRQVPRLTIAGVVCLGFALLSARTELLSLSVYLGFVSPTCLLVGILLLVPLFLEKTLRILRPDGANGRLYTLLALDHMQVTLRRNAVAVSSIVLAIGMSIGISQMIHSFRYTVEDWIEAVTKADIYISASSSMSTAATGKVPPEIIQFLTSHNDVRDYDWVASRNVQMAERRVKVTGTRFAILAKYDRLLFTKHKSQREMEEIIAQPDAVLVSESFANRFAVHEGDTVRIPGLRQSLNGVIRGIFYDFSSEHGTIFIPFDRYLDLFQDDAKLGVSLYIGDSEKEGRIINELQQAFPGNTLKIRYNRELRSEVLRIFDQTFRITYTLRNIALLVAGLTVLTTVLMLLLERQRELCVLKAIGASRRALTATIALESGILGSCAMVLGSVLGVLLSLLLVFVINKFFFGWSVRFSFQISELLITGAGVLILSTLAGAIPAYITSSRLQAEDLRYE